MGTVTVHIEGEPFDVAEFIKAFNPNLSVNLLESHFVNPSETYLTKEDPPAAKPEVYTKEMVMGALKHYGIRLQQQMGLANTAMYVKGLIHSVVGDAYTGKFDSVGEEFFGELYEKAQGTETYGTWE